MDYCEVTAAVSGKQAAAQNEFTDLCRSTEDIDTRQMPKKKG